MSITAQLGNKSIVFVGLMGAGKTSIGRRLAVRIGIPFVDADEEIIKAAGCSIEDIFRLYGEEAFRDGERKVIQRLLGEGPQVLATGGGAFMDGETRDRVSQNAISVWLRADLDELYRRVSRHTHRPLLNDGNARETLARLIEQRYPVYGEADIHVETGSEPPNRTVERVLAGLEKKLGGPHERENQEQEDVE